MTPGNSLRSLLSASSSFVQDARGATAAIFAIALPLLAGMAALAVDVGVWTVQKRQAQGAADQAAYSAAVASKAGVTEAQAETEAKGITAGLGFVHGTGGVTVAVSKLTTLNGVTGEYWQVIVRQPQTGGLASLFLTSAPTATARAVAGGASGGNACVIGLDLTASRTVSFRNNTNLSNANCGVYSNSNSSTSLFCDNNCIVAASTFTVGGLDTKPNSHLNGTNLTGVSPTPDPYAGVTVTVPACTTTAVQNGNSGTIPSGRHCGGFNIPNNRTVTLAAGVHYIDSRFDLGNNVILNATGGTTIVMVPDFKMTAGTDVTLNITAPTSGDFAGIAVMGRGTTASNAPDFKPNMVLHVQGAFYFPNQVLNFENNATFDSTKCTQLVGNRVLLDNNINMNHNCPGSGIRDVGGGTLALLE